MEVQLWIAFLDLHLELGLLLSSTTLLKHLTLLWSKASEWRKVNSRGSTKFAATLNLGVLWEVDETNNNSWNGTVVASYKQHCHGWCSWALFAVYKVDMYDTDLLYLIESENMTTDVTSLLKLELCVVSLSLGSCVSQDSEGVNESWNFYQHSCQSAMIDINNILRAWHLLQSKAHNIRSIGSIESK